MDLWQQKVSDWSRSPSLFVREALGATPEEWQDTELLKPIEEGKRFIAIRAAHGVGKTTGEAWVILWFLLFRRPCKIPVTANSRDQLRDVVWAEIAKWHSKLPPFLRELIEVDADRVYIKSDPNNAFAVARTARKEKPEALQGFHSDHLLFVIEEASGIEEIIFETAGGALTGRNSMVLMCGNPTRSQGYFYNAFHRNRAEWHCVHIPGSRSTQFDPEYANKVEREYGSLSNYYRVRVLGEFPLSEDDAVIPLAMVEAAVGRDVLPTEAGTVWGVDVARFGDDTSALAKRRGNTLLAPIKEWRKLDLMQVTGWIVREWEETPVDERPGAINVDVIGLGAGVVDRLRELQLPVRGINVGEVAALNEKRFMRLRDELWFKARDWFDAKDCRIPKDDILISELVVPKYKIESSGKLKVESKDELKKRGMKSPNKADAFCLTLAGGDYATMQRAPTSAMDYNPFEVGTGDYQRNLIRQQTAGVEDYKPF